MTQQPACHLPGPLGVGYTEDHMKQPFVIRDAYRYRYPRGVRA